MQGRRIKVRRDPLPKPFVAPDPSPPVYKDMGDGLAVYKVLRDTTIAGYYPAKRGETLILPYTAEFWNKSDLLLLREFKE